MDEKEEQRRCESRESCYLHMDGQARTSRGTERGESGRMAGRQQLSAFLFSISHTHTDIHRTEMKSLMLRGRGAGLCVEELSSHPPSDVVREDSYCKRRSVCVCV